MHHSPRSTVKYLLCMIIAAIGFLEASAQLPSYVPREGLVGWWPFNGNANDESGNQLDGEVFGAVLCSDRFSRAATAYSFEGDSNHIQLPIDSLQGQQLRHCTLSFWFQQTDTSLFGFRYLWGSGPKTSRPYGRVGFGMAGGTQELPCTNLEKHKTLITDAAAVCEPVYLSDYQRGTWYHNVVVKRQDTFSVYSQGQLIWNGILAEFRFDSLTLGKRLDNGLEYDGALDEVGLWSRALTDSEISNLYKGSNDGYICSSSVRLDTVAINVKQNSTWTSKPLVAGRTYLLRGYGVWNAAPAPSYDEDFCYTYQLPCDPSSARKTGNPRVGFNLDSMLLGNGLLQPSEQTVNCTDHTYNYWITGTGKPLVVDFRDNPLSDNSGNLTFALYECDDKCNHDITSDSILGYRKVETHQVVTYALRNNPELTYKWIATGGYLLGTTTNHYCDVIWGYDRSGTVCCIVSDSTCADTLCVQTTITEKNTVGVDEVADTPTFVVRPNPVSDILQIDTRNDIIGSEYEVVDVTGRLILSAQGPSAQVSLTNVTEGVYHIVHRDATGQMIGMQRVVVRR